MSDPRRFPLHGRATDDGPALAVRLTDVEVDQSLWNLWPTLQQAVDTASLTPGTVVGHILVEAGTVTAWTIREPFRSDQYAELHDAAGADPQPMTQTIDLPIEYRLFDSTETHSAIVVDQDADTVATPDGESLRGTGIALTFPDVGPANAPLGTLQMFMPSSLPGTAPPPERESTDSDGSDGGSDETDDTTVPQVPDEHCNGKSSDGTLCGLSAGWGRADDATKNPGRCKYHKDQATNPADGGSPFGEGGYGEGGYGGTESA
jgi:hypothetical protein